MYRSMKRLAAVLVIGVLLLGGCASAVWHRAGATQADFDRDRAYCERRIPQPTFNPFQSYQAMIWADVQNNAEHERLLGVCLEDRGWTLRQVASR